MRSGSDNRKSNGKQPLYGVGSYKGGSTASDSQLKVQKPGNKTAGNGVVSGTTGKQIKGAQDSRPSRRE